MDSYKVNFIKQQREKAMRDALRLEQLALQKRQEEDELHKPVVDLGSTEKPEPTRELLEDLVLDDDLDEQRRPGFGRETPEGVWAHDIDDEGEEEETFFPEPETEEKFSQHTPGTPWFSKDEEMKIDEETERQKTWKRSKKRKEQRRSAIEKETLREGKKNTMKISSKELKKMVKEAIKEAKSIQKDTLPGSGEIGKFAGRVDKLLLDTAKEAKELADTLEEEMRVNVLGGPGKPDMAAAVAERNRMLLARVGILRKLAASCVAGWEALRREGV